MPRQDRFELLYQPNHDRPIPVKVTMPDGEGPFPLVIFIHGFKGFMDWGPFPLVAKRLAAAGCMVVRFNGSHNGTTPEHLTTFADPEAFGRNTFSIELDDLGRVLDWGLAEIPVDRKRIALLGHSRGGGLAICKAAEDPRVTRLVTWAAVHSFDHFWTPALLTRWQRDGVQYVVNSRTGEQLPMYITLYDDFMAHHARFDILTLASHISIPWLIIHGTADEAVTVAAAHQLHAAQPNSQLLLLPYAGHTFGGKHPWKQAVLPQDMARAVTAAIAQIP